MKGRTVESDAGAGDITDTYVLFECTNKSNNNLKETICCSPTTAKDLCNLSNTTLPSLFNPLHQEPHATKSSNGGTSSNRAKWDPCRKQLYIMVMIMIIYAGNIDTGKPLFQIKAKLEKNTSQEPKYYWTKSLNTVIHSYKKTFIQILNELEIHNQLKTIRYNLVMDLFNKNYPEIAQYFE